MNREKIRLALSILCGRTNPESLDCFQYDLLGYERRPPTDMLMEKAEEIVLGAICDHRHGIFEQSPRNYEDD